MTATTERDRPGRRIDGDHLRRKAVVYLRQSSPEQVQRHRESTRLQYGLAARAELLGWPSSRIEVIDADLGRSGRSGEREGYAHILSEVALGRIGVIIGYDVSRLSRDQGSWGVLMGLCTEADTLIADVESVYNLNWPKDRLVLGIRGAMAEAEIHTMQLRLQRGREAKAARGELATLLPRGYVRDAGGSVVLDPDAGVRAAVDHVFQLYAGLGSLSATLKTLARDGAKMPHRSIRKEDRGRLLWTVPNSASLQNMLTSPVYAGAFAWGRIRGLGSKAPLETRWRYLVKDMHPAYIGWDAFALNQRQLGANRWRVRGRRGGILSGLLACGRCGRTMMVQYGGDGTGKSYSCRGEQEHGGSRCQSLPGELLEAQVGELALEALSPAAMEISLRAAADAEAEVERRHGIWKKRLQRAGEAAALAERSYRMVDPGNRIVAQTLEDEWEKALAARDGLEVEYGAFCAATPPELAPEERERVRAAARDIAGIWRSGGMSNADKAEILRLAARRVHATVIGDSERVAIGIEWHGARRTEAEIRRPVRTWRQLVDFGPLHRRARGLKAAGASPAAIARRLNAEGWHPARLDRFTVGSVISLLNTGEDGAAAPRRTARNRQAPTDRAPGEWLLDELSEETGVPTPTLFGWIRRGWVAARKEPPPAAGKRLRWLVYADARIREAMREWHRKRLWQGAVGLRPDFLPGRNGAKS